MEYLRKFFNIKNGVILLLSILSVFSGFLIVRHFSSLSDGGEGYHEEVSVSAEDTDIEIDISDFLIPESIASAAELNWVPYRGVEDIWSQEEVDRFWKAPEVIIYETFSKKNRESIEKIFEDVP